MFRMRPIRGASFLQGGGGLEGEIARGQRHIGIGLVHIAGRSHRMLDDGRFSGRFLDDADQLLAALENLCLLPCEEYDDLRRAIAAYKTLAYQSQSERLSSGTTE